MSSISIVHNDPAFVTCKRCGGNGWEPSLANHCSACDGHGEVALDLSDLATLAHNLAIAAFGQRMFELGSEYRMRAMIGLPANEDWKPGCGRSAP